MRILIGADIVPTTTNYDDFMNSRLAEIVDEKLFTEIISADFRIFDLECVLSNDPTFIKKSGPHLVAPLDTKNGLSQLKIDLVTLANNHILDGGYKGLVDTISALDSAKIAHVGAGMNTTEAGKPYILNREECKIGIYACSEHEFSIATDESPGANPVDLLNIFDTIKQLKNTVDFVVVLYHGGREHYRYPSPKLQAICRKLVVSGADLVVTQHSHCVGCVEEYQSGKIVYGQGNFIFDKSENEFRNSGILIEANFNIGQDVSLRFVPMEKDGKGVRYGTNPEIIESFIYRSRQIKERDFVYNNYKKQAIEAIDEYLWYFYGRKSIMLKVLRKLFGMKFVNSFIKSRYKEQDMIAILNYVSCEAHAEIVETGLWQLVNKR